MRASMILGMVIVGMAAVGCQEARQGMGMGTGQDRTILQGSTPSPASLMLTCDDGKVYEAASQVYGVGRARFTLSLPQGSVCRLWISDPRRGTRPVTFYDYRGNLSTLIYLRGSQIYLGRISLSRSDSATLPTVTVESNDLQLMVAGGEEELEAPESEKGGKLFRGSRESDEKLYTY
jgi:hypothetical protein